jgi:hypothetical protein
MTPLPVTVLALLALLWSAGCAATKQANEAKPSGFIGASVPLTKGSGDMPLLYYKNSKADWKSYDKILLDPVAIYRGRDAKDGVPKEDLQRLANNFYNIIYVRYSKYYKMTDKPEPGTLRIQIAITKAEESMPVADVVSSVIPQLRATSLVKDFVTGKPSFVGEASIEGKVTDAVTGELLAAGVDRRVGKKDLTAESFSSWGDVNQSLEYWAARSTWRLCRLKGRSDCEKPEE